MISGWSQVFTWNEEFWNKLDVWLSEEGVSAGFPSPANDFKELRISLDKVVVKNEAATFYAIAGSGEPPHVLRLQ